MSTLQRKLRLRRKMLLVIASGVMAISLLLPMTGAPARTIAVVVPSIGGADGGGSSDPAIGKAIIWLFTWWQG